MDWKPKDWVEHARFGLGQVTENRDDKLDIHFLNAGSRTLIKTASLSPGRAPGPDFKFPTSFSRKKRARFKVEGPRRRPPLDFEHLVSSFKSRFPNGFGDHDFRELERDYKRDAGRMLRKEMGKEVFGRLFAKEDYPAICEIAKRVLQSTNLVHRIEKAKLSDGIKTVASQKKFAKALYDLLYGADDMEIRFSRFSDLLSQIGANQWPTATYYQFLASNGKWMFMKPSIMKRMAECLNVALNYKAEPNWLTYARLQELSDRVDLELRKRGLVPHSRMDVQGFIWTSMSIEEGKYDYRGA